jgi:hypothetical protein
MPLPSDFVPPCLPTRALHPPTGEAWLHEIKHDGFRVIARKDGTRVRLYSRPGNDLTQRFPLIVEALVDAATNYQRSTAATPICSGSARANWWRLAAVRSRPRITCSIKPPVCQNHTSLPTDARTRSRGAS